MINKLSKGIWWLYTQSVLKTKCHSVGSGTIIFKPMQIDNPSSMDIGDGVFVAENSWLMGNKEKDMTLIIGNGTVVGHMAHIIALHNVNIGKFVLIADKVFISDCTHEYNNISVPIAKQSVKMLRNVNVGDGAWIGENVCILGASVGKHSIVGANSVVIYDIPDYSVAVGNPAKVIKRYNSEKKSWVSV